MATNKVIWSNPVVYVNGVDLSANFSGFAIKLAWEEVECTAINDGGKRRAAGLQDNAASGEFIQSWAASSVDQTVAALAGGTVAIMAWPNGSTTGSTNPKYTGNFLINDWTPMDVKPGQLALSPFTWPCDGTVNRAVA